MANYTQKAVRGAGIVFILTICGSLFAYLLRLLLARSLTTAEFGLVYAITNLFALFAILMRFGLDTAIVKYIPEFRVKKDSVKIKSCILIAITILLLVFVIMGIISFIFSDFIAIEYLHPETEKLLELESLLIRIYVIGLITLPLQIVLGAAFLGFQEMKYGSIRKSLTISFTLIFTLILLQFGFGVKAPIISYAISYLLTGMILYIILIKNVFPEFHKIKTVIDKELTIKLLRFGIPVILTGFATIVYSYTDTIILTIYRSLDEVGLYNVGLPTARILWKINIAFVTVLLPISAELWAKNRKDMISRGVKKLYKYSFILIFPFSLFMLLFPEIILNLLFGEEYIGASNVLRILSISSIAISFAKINNTILTGIGKPKEVSKIMISGAVINLIGNLILIPHYGIEGAAFSTAFSFTLVMLVSYMILKRYIKIKLHLNQYIIVSISGLIPAMVVYLIKGMDNMDIYTKLIFSLLLGAIIYLFSLYITKTVTIEEIKDIMRRVM